jgi:hypothetical protein
LVLFQLIERMAIFVTESCHTVNQCVYVLTYELGYNCKLLRTCNDWTPIAHVFIPFRIQLLYVPFSALHTALRLLHCHYSAWAIVYSRQQWRWNTRVFTMAPCHSSSRPNLSTPDSYFPQCHTSISAAIRTAKHTIWDSVQSSHRGDN